MIIRERQSIQPALVGECIAEFHKTKAARLSRLKAYYDGEHVILQRMRAKGAPNHRLVNAYPRYIVAMTSGYLAGNPVSYMDAEQSEALSSLMACYAACDIPSVDAELATHAALYGVGVEVLYMDAHAQPRAATLDPRTAFVVYDDTVEHRALFGVHWRANRVELYTDETLQTLEGDDWNHLSPAGLPEPHYFGQVPMTEYWNNADERGDFESVLSLIDAYDALQSDRVNDKQQFADSLLVFTGVGGLAMDGDGEGRPIGQRLREDKALALPDRDAKVEWLTKQLNESDTQVLADSIRTDIHKMAMVPDLTDRMFAGNATGVAMRFKLLGFDQLIKVKERWFREALRTRLALFSHIRKIQGAPALEAGRVQIAFSRSIPVNELEIAQTIRTLHGLVPDRLLLTQVPFITDAEAAYQELLTERKGL